MKTIEQVQSEIDSLALKKNYYLTDKENKEVNSELQKRKDAIAIIRLNYSQIYLESVISKLKKEVERDSLRFYEWEKHTPLVEMGNNPTQTFENLMNIPHKKQQIKNISYILEIE